MWLTKLAARWILAGITERGKHLCLIETMSDRGIVCAAFDCEEVEALRSYMQTAMAARRIGEPS